MSIKKDPTGRRSVQVEVEVPGTPEEVWQAIATGPGISAWFVPSQVDGKVGGTTKCDFGPGMESISTITEWNAPNRFTSESNDLGPGAPTIATEWIVEAKSGGTCIVRVVHSLFASTDDWDNQMEGWEGGWPGFFRILRLYLTYFRGQASAAFQAGGMTAKPTLQAWERLTHSLGFGETGLGQHVASQGSAPAIAGIVEHVGAGDHPEELLLRLERPTGGLAHLFAMAMGPQVYLSVRLYLYGEDAAATAKRESNVWTAWMQEHFPMPGS